MLRDLPRSRSPVSIPHGARGGTGRGLEEYRPAGTGELQGPACLLHRFRRWRPARPARSTDPETGHRRPRKMGALQRKQRWTPPAILDSLLAYRGSGRHSGRTIAAIASLGATFLAWTGISLAIRRLSAAVVRRRRASQSQDAATPVVDAALPMPLPRLQSQAVSRRGGGRVEAAASRKV